MEEGRKKGRKKTRKADSSFCSLTQKREKAIIIKHITLFHPILDFSFLSLLFVLLKGEEEIVIIVYCLLFVLFFICLDSNLIFLSFSPMHIIYLLIFPLSFTSFYPVPLLPPFTFLPLSTFSLHSFLVFSSFCFII